MDKTEPISVAHPQGIDLSPDVWLDDFSEGSNQTTRQSNAKGEIKKSKYNAAGKGFHNSQRIFT